MAAVLDQAALELGDRFAGSQRNRVVLLESLAHTYKGLGLYDKAAKLYERAVTVCRMELGPDDPETLRLRNYLGQAYTAAERVKEAIAMHEETLKIREAKLGPDHRDTLTSRDNLATAYVRTRRVPEAIALLEPTLKREEAKLGPDHPTRSPPATTSPRPTWRRAGGRGDRAARADAREHDAQARPRQSRDAHAAATTSPRPTTTPAGPRRSRCTSRLSSARPGSAPSTPRRS